MNTLLRLHDVQYYKRYPIRTKATTETVLSVAIEHCLHCDRSIADHMPLTLGGKCLFDVTR